MNSPTTAPVELDSGKERPVKRRAKGEQTRRKILDATLRLIARSGLRSVTHRSVATEAGVQLSLTTYYFKDIQDLIAEAFGHFTSRHLPELDTLWTDLDSILLRYPAAVRRKASEKEALCEELVALLRTYLSRELTERNDELKVEQIFFAEVSLNGPVGQQVDAYFDSFYQSCLKLCRKFNRQDPEIDAELFLHTILSIEFKLIGKTLDDDALEHMTRQLKRLLGWIIGLKRYS